jgi:hypothetical protein
MAAAQETLLASWQDHCSAAESRATAAAAGMAAAAPVTLSDSSQDHFSVEESRVMAVRLDSTAAALAMHPLVVLVVCLEA